MVNNIIKPTPMSSKSKKFPLFNSDTELAEFLHQSVSDSLKQAIKMTVTVMIRTEMEQFRKEVDKKLSFNGSYERNMTSPAGKIPGIEVPRFRQLAQQRLSLSSTGIFEAEKQRFFMLISEMHRQGISQRKISHLAETCFGIKISKERVGLLHRELAAKEEFQINRKPVSDEFDYLLLDGIWVKAKQFGLADSNKVVLLCALGITKQHERKIIGFQVAQQEDTQSWRAFAEQLKRRGLTGKSLSLVIADDNAGLASALDQVYPHTKIQICMAHKQRNVIGKTSYPQKRAVADDLKAIYAKQTKKEAIAAMKSFCKKWYVSEEKAVTSLRYNFEKTLTYLEFPPEIWRQIRTTNILEREFREVRRRIKVFDSSFESNESLNTYANSIFTNLNAAYPSTTR